MIPGLEPKPEKAPRRTAKDMLAMLAKHYEPPPSKPHGGRLVEEIQAPRGTRRADALYMPITTAGRGTIIGHEIKVTRSDVITELRDPHKADSWLRYCSRWWLVVADAAFLDGLDVPAEWGVLAPPSRANTRFMTVVRQAPTLTPDPAIMSEAWGTIFAKVAYADIAEMNALQRALGDAAEWRKRYNERAAEVTRLQRAVGEDIADGSHLSRARSKAMKVADILAEIERLGGYGDETPKALQGMLYDIDAEQVARGILATAAVNEKDYNSVDRAVNDAIERADRAAARLREVLTEITPKGKAP
ncbi:hypothetical protein QDA02_gp37 [Microbacterium phage Margaery]|uniref:Uncharacterized protein n=1 Tax=Microbacterium phage Margaery TaxID=2591217 RepID=A0A514DHN5_9CAUD|nr:hypothetical protein QDA02_gp37 [Microbacterium phage Margaery]QDH93128.1 hypothetical protein PBI_MARGAERY_71 [Microbacterium phage Margaery]